MPLWLACRSRGVALMPVDGGTPTAEIAALALRFGATTAILPASTPGLEALGDATPFDSTLVAVRLSGTTPAPEIYRGAAALKVTSGSTGLPKATFTRESQLVADTAHIVTAMGIGPDDCQIAAIPISHAYGLGNLVIPLLVQGTPIVLREAFIPQQLHADATKYGARVFPGVPFMFAHFANNPDAIAWPSVLETLVSAGAPLDPVMASTLRANVRREDSLFLRRDRRRRHLVRRLAGCRGGGHGGPAVAGRHHHAPPGRGNRRRADRWRTSARRGRCRVLRLRRARRRPTRDSRTGASSPATSDVSTPVSASSSPDEPRRSSTSRERKFSRRKSSRCCARCAAWRMSGCWALPTPCAVNRSWRAWSHRAMV